MAKDFFRHEFLNLLQDDLVHAKRQDKITLFHCQWAVVTFMGIILGMTMGGQRYGWLGCVLGLPIGMFSGFIIGWLLYGVGVLFVSTMLHLFHRRGWFE